MERELRMTLEGLFRQTAKMEITYISGILHVEIDHDLNFIRLCLDGAIFAWIVWGETSVWSRSSLFSRGVVILVFFTTLGDLVYQVTGSEIIEFSTNGLKRVTTYFGWRTVRDYEISQCGELTWEPRVDQHHDLALECKVGWKRVRFGKYLSETQAQQLLSDLQNYLPDVAAKMGMTKEDRRSSMTRLNLS